jgi:hypothetical protein
MAGGAGFQLGGAPFGFRFSKGAAFEFDFSHSFCAEGGAVLGCLYSVRGWDFPVFPTSLWQRKVCGRKQWIRRR